MIEAVEQVPGGYVIQADSTYLDLCEDLQEVIGLVPLIIADPPYGNIVDEGWDQAGDDPEVFVTWMLGWTSLWENLLLPGGAFYVWGGVGKPGFRPFLKYLTKVERPGEFELANLITWSKKRAYGVQNNYLFTREECAYFVKGDAKKPRTFRVPLLEMKRDYPGYDPEYPAKSEYYRRTNVWTDVTEILRGKLHPTQKVQRVLEIPIEVHTEPEEWVVDLFAGAGTTALAARRLGRKFVVIEKDKTYFEDMLRRLR